jgi:hypothetical protein
MRYWTTVGWGGTDDPRMQRGLTSQHQTARQAVPILSPDRVSATLEGKSGSVLRSEPRSDDTAIPQMEPARTHCVDTGRD